MYFMEIKIIRFQNDIETWTQVWSEIILDPF